MTSRLLTVSALFVACSAAQQPSVNPSEPKQIRVEGRVLDLNGAPVRKANVHLQSPAQPAPATPPPPGQAPPGYSQTSDDAGKFAFENVAPGRYTLNADKAGFLPARYGARSDSSPAVELTVAPSDNKKGLDLKMIPQGVIIGRVLDQDGDPIANAQVTASRFGYSNGHKTLIAAAGSSNPAAAAQGVIAEATPEPVSIVTYYPNSPDATGAAPVNVAAGSEVRGIDIRVLKARVYSIRGKVVDTATGGPVTGAMVAVMPQDETEMSAASLLANMSQSAADGSFEIRNLLPGTYTLQCLTIPGLANALAGGRGGPAPASMTPPKAPPGSKSALPVPA